MKVHVFNCPDNKNVFIIWLHTQMSHNITTNTDQSAGTQPQTVCSNTCQSLSLSMLTTVLISNRWI